MISVDETGIFSIVTDIQEGLDVIVVDEHRELNDDNPHLHIRIMYGSAAG